MKKIKSINENLLEREGEAILERLNKLAEANPEDKLIIALAYLVKSRGLN
jgi:hypothetical protein